MKAFIDRIEAGIATLILSGDPQQVLTISVPLLPAGTREGSVVDITIILDEAETNASHQRIQTLLDSLPNEP